MYTFCMVIYSENHGQDNIFNAIHISTMPSSRKMSDADPLYSTLLPVIDDPKFQESPFS